jgi:hypothetical protein
MLLCAVIGLTLGALLGGGIGSLMGLMVGAGLGFIWTSVQVSGSPPAEGTRVERERRRVVCVPRGQQADCVFLRDRDTHRWLDVAACSLSHPARQINCRKRCLILMNDVAD